MSNATYLKANFGRQKKIGEKSDGHPKETSCVVHSDQRAHNYCHTYLQFVTITLRKGLRSQAQKGKTNEDMAKKITLDVYQEAHGSMCPHGRDGGS